MLGKLTEPWNWYLHRGYTYRQQSITYIKSSLISIEAQLSITDPMGNARSLYMKGKFPWGVSNLSTNRSFLGATRRHFRDIWALTKR